MSEMLRIATGFQNSVNIGFDINNDEKIRGFIPTEASLELLQEIIESTCDASNDRARVLVGSYGRGKSHIVLTILSMLMGKKRSLFKNIEEKISNQPKLEKLISNYYSSGKRFLPVFANVNGSSLQQSFIVALQKALSDFDLLDVMPETNFQAAVRTINMWEEEYPATYEQFKSKISCPVKEFVENLLRFSVETYSEFEKIYPSLTAGSKFNPFLGFDVVDLYEKVSKAIAYKGYTGIFVVYDEFSKYLEANIKHIPVSDTKLLQDFAEKCNRSGKNQLHLLLISHKEISNYIDELPKQKLDGWRGVSERFKHVRMNTNYSQTYEMVSSVILKSKEKWLNFCSANSDSFDSVKRNYSESPIFSDLDMDLSLVVKDCYPLHPVTLYILPRLSELVAQNERTMFTFLSKNGKSTLPSFLDGYHDDCFVMLTPDLLFDYFESSFREESYSSENYHIYMLTKTILSRFQEDSLKTKLVKTICLIYILNQFERIQPTVDELYKIYSIEYSADEVRRVVETLINDDRVVYLKSSNQHLTLKAASCVDVKKQVEDNIDKLAARFSTKDTLNRIGTGNYIYPSKYNDDREMTRYFKFEFIESSEVEVEVDWNTKGNANASDGMIYGIIPSINESVDELKERVVECSKGYERTLFVVPRFYSDIKEVALKFNSVYELKNSVRDNDVLFNEYEIIYEDLYDVVLEFIRTYTYPEKHSALYVYNGEIVEIHRKTGLSNLLSKICETVYPKTPIINNEAINKHEITGVAFNSRSKIIAGLLRNELEENLGLTGSGQDVSILRSTLVRTNILSTDENGVTSVSLTTEDECINYMFGVFIEFFQKAKQDGVCSFGDLFNNLTSAEGEIGMRRSLIPIYLAVVLHEYKHEAVIFTNSGQENISVETVLKIEADPSSYSLKYLDWDYEKQQFVQILEKLFKDYINPDEKALSSYEYIVLAMKRWYISLPKYSKEHVPSEENKKYICLGRLLKQNIGGIELLFERLPRNFGKNVGGELAKDIEHAKAYYDKTIELLTTKLISETKELFAMCDVGVNAKDVALVSVINDWCNGLNPSVYEELFSNGTNRCLKYFRENNSDDLSFVKGLAKVITELRLEDWNDNTPYTYLRTLEDYKITAEGYTSTQSSSVQNKADKYVLTYLDEFGNAITKRFDGVDETKRGKLLKNSILEDIESMGHSISEQEKRQILMEVLKELC